MTRALDLALLNRLGPSDPIQALRDNTQELTPAQLSNIGMGFAPGAGLAEFKGQFPQFPDKDLTTAEMLGGQRNPSYAEDVAEGRYFDAGLKGVGAFGDVLTATVPIVGAAAGRVLQAPRVLITAMRSLNVNAPEEAIEIIKNMDAMQLTDLASGTGVDAGELLQTAMTQSNVPVPTSYHGSGAGIDKVDLSFMDESGSMQAHGKGFYATGQTQTAEQYFKIARYKYDHQLPPKEGSSADMLASKYNLPRGQDMGSQEWSNYGDATNKRIRDLIDNELSADDIMKDADFDSTTYIFPDQSYIVIDDRLGPKAAGGSMGGVHKLDINADVDQFIQENLPFSQQSEFVKQKLYDHFDADDGRIFSNVTPQENLNNLFDADLSGSYKAEEALLGKLLDDIPPPTTLLEKLELMEGNELADVMGIADDDPFGPALQELKKLSDRGIKGIRYFDDSYASDFRVELYDPNKHPYQTSAETSYVVVPSHGGYGVSRFGAGEDLRDNAISFHKTKEEAIENLGSRSNKYNYVIFDPEIIKISKMYGVSIPVAATMLYGANAEEYYQLKGEA